MTKAEEYACRYAGFSSPPTRRDCLENREQKDVYYAVLDGYERAEEDLALTIDDIERLHTFLYAIKNNKQGVFTFTRLSDEQYEEVLKRFNKTRNNGL